MKKPKPPKMKKRQLPHVAQPTTAAPLIVEAQKPTIWSKISAFAKGLGLIGGVLGLIFTIMRLWPQIAIEPTAAADASNPFSGYFKITNEQAYPLTDVGVEASLWCARIGRGDNTSPIDKCERSMRTSKQRWTKHVLEPHEPYEITPSELMFVTPASALLYAQVSIFVTYKPWKLPIHGEKEFRFESRRLPDGKIEWLHIPVT
jgi:hypothetical protein